MRRAFHRELISLNGNNQLRRLRQLRSHPGDPKPLNGIPRGRYFFHFHPAFGAHKQDVALRMPAFDFVSNGQGAVDVATRSPSGDNNAVEGMRRISHGVTVHGRFCCPQAVFS